MGKDESVLDRTRSLSKVNDFIFGSPDARTNQASTAMRASIRSVAVALLQPVLRVISYLRTDPSVLFVYARRWATVRVSFTCSPVARTHTKVNCAHPCAVNLPSGSVRFGVSKYA